MQPPHHLTPALRRWLTHVVDEYCIQRGDGTAELAITQIELGERLGHRRRSGTVGEQIRKLHAAGAVLSRRPVVFDLRALDRHPAPQGPAAPDATNQPHLASGNSLDTLCTIAHLAAQQGQWDVVRSSVSAIERLGLGALEQNPAAHAGADRGTSPRTRRAPAAQTPRTGREPTQTAKRSLLSAPQARTAHRDPAPNGRTNDDVRALLEPLTDACIRHHLPGIANVNGVRTALEHLSDQAVEAGVSYLCARIAAGSAIRSPVAVLVAMAKRGEILDPGTPPSPAGPPPDSDTDSGEDSLWCALRELGDDDPDTLRTLAQVDHTTPVAVARVQAYLRAVEHHAGDAAAAAAAIGRGKVPDRHGRPNSAGPCTDP